MQDFRVVEIDCRKSLDRGSLNDLGFSQQAII
jgi:hypothetical protein